MTEQDPQDEGARQPGFDARLQRLEGLVTELEDGGLDLEASIERYKEGVALLKGCREMLDGYRRQVEELAQDGTVRAHAADPDGDA